MRLPRYLEEPPPNDLSAQRHAGRRPLAQILVLHPPEMPGVPVADRGQGLERGALAIVSAYEEATRRHHFVGEEGRGAVPHDLVARS